ncbi:MAG: hypothetical protein ACI31R_00455 [Bacilli bacterium]
MNVIMKISIDELRTFKQNKDWYNEHGDGYRIVYFYPNGTYYIGAISKTIEGFMINFCDEYPIMDEEDIPKFVSNDNLLSRYLQSLNDISGVAIYKTDGTCIAKKERKIKKQK